MKEERQIKKQITIPAFITSAVCYAAMWAIMARTENAFFAGYIGEVGTVDQVKHILICILIGVILFVLPLEKICDKTYCVIRYCGSLMTDKKKYWDGTAVFLLVFLLCVGLSGREQCFPYVRTVDLMMVVTGAYLNLEVTGYMRWL
mgnify:CR=1 FL=1